MRARNWWLCNYVNKNRIKPKDSKTTNKPNSWRWGSTKTYQDRRSYIFSRIFAVEGTRERKARDQSHEESGRRKGSRGRNVGAARCGGGHRQGTTHAVRRGVALLVDGGEGDRGRALAVAASLCAWGAARVTCTRRRLSAVVVGRGRSGCWFRGMRSTLERRGGVRCYLMSRGENYASVALRAR